MSRVFKAKYGGSVRGDASVKSVNKFTDKFSVQKPGEYARCLLDPENNPAVSIPDECSYPTTCFTVKQEISTPVQSTGVCGIIVHLGVAPVFLTESGLSTDGAYAYNASVPFDANADILLRYQACRLVAASLRCEFVGNDSNNAGLVTVSSIGRTQVAPFALDDVLPTSGTVQRNFRETYVGPVKDGSYSTYRPVDAISFQMQKTGAAAATTNYGTLIGHVGGMNTAALQGTACVWYVTMHFEGLWKNPTSSSVNVDPAVTPLVNPQELAITQSILPAFPLNNSGLMFSLGDVSAIASDVSDAVQRNAPSAYRMLQGAASVNKGLRGIYSGYQSMRVGGKRKRLM